MIVSVGDDYDILLGYEVYSKRVLQLGLNADAVFVAIGVQVTRIGVSSD